MRIKANVAGWGLLILFTAAIGFSMIMGWWKTEGSKVPATIKTGDFAGASNPADIRGSYSLQNIEDAFAIDSATLAKAFGLSGQENYEAIQVKILEETYEANESGEIGTDSVRWFVALYWGMPYVPEEGTALLQSGFSILRKEGKMSDADYMKASEHLYSHKGDEPVLAAAGEEDTHTESEEMLIKGKTTFADLLSWGLNKENIEEVLGMEMGSRVMAVRDFCLEKEIEFSTVKEPLQALLDEHN